MGFNFPIDVPSPGTRDIPRVTRQAVLFRARGRCESCGQRLPIELHHLHYETVGTESPDDLLALCRDCHKRKHIDPAGVWWNDPQDMEHHWQPYWDELERD